MGMLFNNLSNYAINAACYFNKYHNCAFQLYSKYRFQNFYTLKYVGAEGFYVRIFLLHYTNHLLP